MMCLPGDTCRTCEHWSNELPTLASGMRRPAGSDPDKGSCHRLSPTVFVAAGIPMSLFPETHAEQFCADWSPELPDDDDGGGEEADADNVVPFRDAA
jgi:hypothetical protein